MGTETDDGDLGELKGPEKHDYHPISTTLKRRREIYFAKVLQKCWKTYLMNKKIAQATEDLKMLDGTSLFSYRSDASGKHCITDQKSETLVNTQ